MGKTGLLGEPMEFFNPRSSLYNHISKSKAKNVVDYMNYLKSTFSTGRDLFGFKTNFFDFHPFIQSGVYKKIFRGTKFIFLTRENVIAQAISLYLASKKDVWHKTKTNSFIGDSSKEKMDIPFDSQRILSCMNNLIHEKANWEYFFQVADIEPLYLTYERMFADFKGTIYKISDFLGTQLDEDTLIETDFVKISNEVNESFKHQILEQWKIGPDNRLLNSSVKSLDKDVHV
jgi:LPS sulfotransferase NodH